jgi:HEAT repeat protein
LLDSKDKDLRESAASILSNIGPPARKFLVEALKNNDEDVRLRVVLALGRQPLRADFEIATYLISALDDPSSEVRSAAATALVSTYGDRAVAYAKLSVLLRDSDSKVKHAAARALGFLAVPEDLDTKNVVPSLIAALAEPDEEVKLEAASAVAKIGKDASDAELALLQILEQTKDSSERVHETGKDTSNPDLKKTVISALGKVGGRPETVRALILMLQEADQRYRLASIESLAQIGSRAQTAAPFVAKLIEEPDMSLRRQAFKTLIEMGDTGITLLEDYASIPNPAIRREAIDTLGENKIADEGSVGAVLAAMQDVNDEVRSSAVKALGEIGDRSDKVLRALIKALRDDRTKLAAATALGKLTPESKIAVDELVPLLEDANDEVRNSAAKALGEIGDRSDKVLRALIKALRDDRTKLSAATALGKLAPESKIAADELTPMLHDPSFEVRGSAARALAAMEPESIAAIPALINALDPEDYLSDIKFAVVDAIVKVGNPAIPFISASLREKEVNPEVVSMVGNLGKDANSLAPDLIRLIGNPNARVRMAAITTVARINPDWELVRPALVKALNDPDHLVRRAALDSLSKIGGANAASSIVAELKNSDKDVRELAAQILIRIGIGSVNPGRAFITVLNDKFIETYNTGSLSAFRNYFNGALCQPQLLLSAPSLHWPPPQYSARDVLPRVLLGKADATLGMIYERLTSALEEAGYGDTGAFSIPGGFALVSRVERIDERGKPFPEPYRWANVRVPLLNLADYFGQLFLERRGLFRLIVFAVTDEVLQHENRELKEEDARGLFLAGAVGLTPDISKLSFANRNCYVLVYEFQRGPGETKQDIPSLISTREHLVQAGLWNKFVTTAVQ